MLLNKIFVNKALTDGNIAHGWLAAGFGDKNS